jgi:DNA polymerase-3 subunit epsilon
MKSGPLARRAFALKGRVNGTVADGLLSQLLGGDVRFIRAEGSERRWNLACNMDPTPLEQVKFTVLDVETTGGQPNFNRVIEIGAFHVCNGEVGRSFISLINPGRSIPLGITFLTGIKNEDVADAPRFSDIADDLLSFCEGTVFAGHSAMFDFRFINTEMQRSNRPYLECASVCTVRLSRRLLPGLPSHSLDSVAAHFGLGFGPDDERHRGSGDAWATAHALIHFLEIARERHQVQTIEDLLRFQAIPPSKLLS